MIAIYARQSVDKKDSISIETQVADCKHEVKKEKYEVYIDRGSSGKNLDRDEFKRMMVDIKAGKISKVVCYKLDRISRSILDFAKTMETFTEFKVEFVSMNEKFDTSTAMGRAMLSICVVFAQLERETIQMRVADAYSSRSRSGYYMGGRIAYGFKKVPHTIDGKNTSQYEPRPNEVEQLKVLFDIYAKPSTSLADIVRYFSENNIQKTRGIEWSTSRLTEILRNPIYVKADVDLYNFYKSRQTEIVNDISEFIGVNGCYLYTKPIPTISTKSTGAEPEIESNKSETKTKTKNKIKNMAHYKDMMLVLAPHEGFIDSDTFIRCRLKAEQNVQIPNGRHSHTSWISGKLKCKKCGYAMRYNKWTGKTTINEYYMCSGVPNKKCDGVGAIHKDVLESVVFEKLKEKIQSLKIEQSQPNPHQADINALKVKITAKECEIEKTLENFASSSPAVVVRMSKVVDKLADEIADLNNEIFKLETSKSHRSQLDTDAMDVIFANWAKISKEDRQKLVAILVTKVFVTKENIEIVWEV